MKELSSVNKECAKCPKYEPPRLWCPLRAEQRHPASPACRYGIVLMGAAKQKENRDAKTSS